MFAWRRSAIRKRVLVSLKTDKAIRGILWTTRGPLLVIKDPELLTMGGQPPVKLDGEVIIERSNVDFVQIIGDVAAAE